MQYLLIVSPVEFNEATKLPVILPITNGGKFARRYTGATASRLRPTADYPPRVSLVGRRLTPRYDRDGGW